MADSKKARKMTTLKIHLESLCQMQDLSAEDMSFCMNAIASGEVSDIQVSAFLMLLRAKGPPEPPFIGPPPSNARPAPGDEAPAAPVAARPLWVPSPSPPRPRMRGGGCLAQARRPRRWRRW